MLMNIGSGRHQIIGDELKRKKREFHMNEKNFSKPSSTAGISFKGINT